MRDAKRASELLMAAVSAAGRDDWEAVAEYLNAHRGLTPCTVMMCLARVIATATMPLIAEDEVAVATAYVDSGEQVTPELIDDLDVIGAVISAICNGDQDGAHEVVHQLPLAQAHRVITRLLTTTYMVVSPEGTDARNN